MIKVEKRIPFAFKGEWGKVYKLYNFEEKTENQIVKWQRSNYVDIGQDVQFKYIESGIDKTISTTTPIMNLATNSVERVVKTTDAYFNVKTNRYDCVANVGDIIFLFGEYWVVSKIDEKSIYTPAKQTIYYCGLKKINDSIL